MFAVLGLVAVVVFAAMAVPRGEQAPLTDQDIQELREDAPDGFVRQEDGGEFTNPKKVVDALAIFGIACEDPDYFTSKTDDQVVECWTGVAKVNFVVAKPGDSTFRSRVTSDPGSQRLTNLVLLGRNWALIAPCDVEYANSVQRAIGGKYLRQHFQKPSNC
ncbi:hypothetical protein [Nonomuraea bangladeshensis]|uniref:hypothetical protein n=1 Tax=Nonomuraea bangladeshensis TaxID=404385 RepID=UPI0031D723A9